MTPTVRGPGEVTARALGPGVTGSELLGDEQGCRGLHQRRLRFAAGAELGGTAAGRGESWYVTNGSELLGVFYPAGSPAAKQAC